MSSTIEFDRVIDVTDSEAFAQGYIDWGTDRDDAYIYLVFRSGTHVSRRLPEFWDNDLVDRVTSWGHLWHSEIHAFPAGPTIEQGVEFVQRAERKKNMFSFTAYAAPLAPAPAPFAPVSDELTTDEDEEIIVADDLDEPEFVDEDIAEDVEVEGVKVGGSSRSPFTFPNATVSLEITVEGRADLEKVTRILYDTVDFIAENVESASNASLATLHDFDPNK